MTAPLKILNYGPRIEKFAMHPHLGADQLRVVGDVDVVSNQV